MRTVIGWIKHVGPWVILDYVAMTWLIAGLWIWGDLLLARVCATCWGISIMLTKEQERLAKKLARYKR